MKRLLIRKFCEKRKLGKMFTPEKLSETLIEVDHKDNEIGTIPILDAHLMSEIQNMKRIHRSRLLKNK